MARRSAGMVLVFLLLAACGSGINHDSPNFIHFSNREYPDDSGQFHIYYRYERMINEYGPGMEEVRRRIDHAPGDSRALWFEAEKEVVINYTNSKGLAPEVCEKGIVVSSNRSDEGGGGTAVLRCK